MAFLFPVAGAFAADPLAAGRLGDPMKWAKTAFEHGSYREAEKIYERILTKVPNNLLALENLGVARFRAGKLEAAADALLRAIAAAPKDDFPHCLLGVVYYSQGRYEEAADSLITAVGINPTNFMAHQYLSLTAVQLVLHEEDQVELKTMVGDFFTPLEQSRLRLPEVVK